jgi:hypothetical protein
MAWCSICGITFEWNEQHQCQQSTLDRIDAAHRRDPDSENERRKTFGQRLADGVSLLNQNQG